MVMKTSRPYVMRARADAADQTRARIVRAAVDLCAETMSLDFGLAEVAARAGTSVQTVLRHYGSRDGLLQAGQRLAQAEVIAERQARCTCRPVSVTCRTRESRLSRASMARLQSPARS